jgi:hypothetical protein
VHLDVARYNLLKYFDYTLVHSQEVLLAHPINMWRPNHHLFEVHGKMIELFIEVEIYFLMRLPLQGDIS